ncbi:molybdenum cofactor guanylyltransferase [Sphingomonas sp. NBWT7]|uniref:molybdenum cofactor guanylyltransferase n=1 Tax=Sphingomonas sp. NBWT7 TaxID=2596913 RepID=UPI00162741BE|nr:molybdenum cofactor guanylyltransferase [Sphingomonas sp. NBWT7]QNE32161.1 molybdenum cofactor guanylyltransferase [Sphingomonas sp. NBWT7]
MTGPSPRILGAILAGGQSSRFGADKALALLGGKTLLDHVAASLAPQVDALAVVGRAYADINSIADVPRPGLGPLGALAGALRYAVEGGFGAVLSVPCDAPVLPGDLRRILSGDGAAYLRDLPVIGWWPAMLARPLARWLDDDNPRSVRRWADTVGARAIAVDRLPPNINTPADLAALGG